MTQASGYSLLVRQAIEPLNEKQFLLFLEALGSIAPPVLKPEQLVALLASILQNYCNTEDVSRMEQLVEAAIDTIVGLETTVALDAAVGPEDGVH